MGSTGELVVVARQPFFDAERRVLGYEVRTELTPSDATVRTVAGARPAFVPLSAQALLDADVHDLQPANVVLQVPGSIEPTPAVRDACAEFRRRGFRIALDRFHPDGAVSPMMRYVDYVTADPDTVAHVAHRPQPTLRPFRQPALVAVGVNAMDQYEAAAALGFTMFQGDVFVQPRRLATSNIAASHMTRLRLVGVLQDPDMSVVALEELIKPDAALCLRVLRTVNGAAYAQRTRITSLRQALLLVGVGTIREWATAWTMAEFSSGAPEELVVMASVRGRFCELMSKGALASTGGDGFLLGMCSLLEGILEAPVEAILEHLPLCESNAAALLGAPNGQRALLDAAIAWEQGRWQLSRALAAGAGLDQTRLPSAYNDALAWMNRLQVLATA